MLGLILGRSAGLIWELTLCRFLVIAAFVSGFLAVGPLGEGIAPGWGLGVTDEDGGLSVADLGSMDGVFSEDAERFWSFVWTVLSIRDILGRVSVAASGS